MFRNNDDPGYSGGDSDDSGKMGNKKSGGDSGSRGRSQGSDSDSSDW